MLEKLKTGFPRLVLIWADGGYAGQLVEWACTFAHWTLQIVKRTDDLKGFVVLPKRWIVERTLAWLGRYRRLSKDYELLPETEVAWVQVAMIHIMVRRLSPSTPEKGAAGWHSFRRSPAPEADQSATPAKRCAQRRPAKARAAPPADRVCLTSRSLPTRNSALV